MVRWLLYYFLSPVDLSVYGVIIYDYCIISCLPVDLDMYGAIIYDYCIISCLPVDLDLYGAMIIVLFVYI